MHEAIFTLENLIQFETELQKSSTSLKKISYSTGMIYNIVFIQLDIALACRCREPTPFTPVEVIIITESPIGLINLKEICQFGTQSAKHFKLTGVTFGADDFLARLGTCVSTD